MLTKISATTAAVSAICSCLTLFGLLDWTAEQIAGLNLAIVALGTLVHAWFNPAIPFGASE